MVFDLRRALLRKEEVESARLADFAFRQRVRAMRLLARRLGLDEEAAAARPAHGDDAGVLDALAAELALNRATLAAAHGECLAQARAALIAERGDPAPHRLG